MSDFNKAYASAEVQARFSIKRGINDEINPKIAEINKQYRALINDIETVEIDAEEIIEESEKVTENTSVQSVKVFVSYSHKDLEHLKALHSALAPLVRLQKLVIWDDRTI